MAGAEPRARSERPGARPSAARAWLAAIRPATLWAGVTPVLVGAALAGADATFRIGPALAALAGAVLIQIGTNLHNDWADFARGADTAERVGPARPTQRGWLTPRQVLAAALGSFGAAALIGVYLVAVGGWPILAIGLASLAAAWAYTGGPWPLGYVGLGDVFVFVFFGLAAVCGTYYVQSRSLTPEIVMAALAMGLLATAILVVNNLRDRVTDAAAGKRTLAVRFGPVFTRGEYTACLAGAYALVVAVALWRGRFGWLFPLASLPMAYAQTVGVWRKDGPALNAYLGGTARLQALFGLLLAAGVLL